MSLFVWSDVDLDGVGSILALSWFAKRTLPNRITTSRNFRKDFENWYRHEGHNFQKIFICDLDVSANIDIIDQKNIFIIDHHDNHILESNRYSKCNTLIKKSGSTTKLIYDTYKDSMNAFKEQKLLINLIDDYDSNELKYPLSEDLNRLYWSLTGDRVQKFIDSFYNGFSGFSRQQKNSINIYNKKLRETLSKIDVHVGDIDIGGKSRRIVSTITSFGINDVAKNIISTYNADIGIVVNPNSGTVSFRRSDKCTLPMNELAKKLANGGGHKEAAGGSITDQFMNFTKNLKKI